jgi:hypothetical protein
MTDRERRLDEAAETILRVVHQLGITHDELARRMRANERIVERVFGRSEPPRTRAFCAQVPEELPHRTRFHVPIGCRGNTREAR